jgi:dihydrofolate reductase
MKTPEIAIVVAMDQKKGIGKNGQLPWPRIPEDMQRFKEETGTHPVIMGRKTYESLPLKYRPLPGRQNIVITRNPEVKYDGVLMAHSLEEAIRIAKPLDEHRICIVGGGEIYKEALSLTDILLLTKIEGDFDADTFFPEYLEQFTQTKLVTSEFNGLKYSFQDLVRDSLNK